MRRVVAGLFLASALAMTAAAEEGRVTEDDMTILPRPTLWALMFGGYTPDFGATEAHYNKVFEGKTAAEVVEALEGLGFRLIYDNDETISLLVKQNVGFLTYSSVLMLQFADGVFAKAQITSAGIK